MLHQNKEKLTVTDIHLQSQVLQYPVSLFKAKKYYAFLKMWFMNLYPVNHDHLLKVSLQMMAVRARGTEINTIPDFPIQTEFVGAYKEGASQAPCNLLSRYAN